MATKAPSIHSQFKERLVVAVRAPDGDSARAVALRRLVVEMNERHATGHLMDWMIDALLDRMARDRLGFENLGVAVGRAAENPIQPRSVGFTEAADSQRDMARGEGVKTTSAVVPLDQQQDAMLDKPVEAKRMGAGLRVMG